MSANGKQLHEDAVAAAPAIVDAMNDAQRLAMAKVGLNALIDEATGFQRVRPVDALRTMAKGLATAIAEAPKRVQLSRRRGYRKPDGAVVVSRPSKWGNPFGVKAIKANGGRWRPGGRAAETLRRQREAVGLFRSYVQEKQHVPEIQAELRGKDLACWCPLDQPCHADVLLEIANS